MTSYGCAKTEECTNPGRYFFLLEKGFNIIITPITPPPPPIPIHSRVSELLFSAFFFSLLQFMKVKYNSYISFLSFSSCSFLSQSQQQTLCTTVKYYM